MPRTLGQSSFCFPKWHRSIKYNITVPMIFVVKSLITQDCQKGLRRDNGFWGAMAGQRKKWFRKDFGISV